jgi:hypothetical protein
MDGAQEQSRIAEPPPVIEALGRTTRLRIVLLFLVSAQLVVLTFMPYERRVVWTQIRTRQYQLQIWWLGRHDPRPGTGLCWSDYGLQVRSSGPAGIIAIDDCEGCTIRAIHDLAVRLKGRKVKHLYAVVLKPPKPAAIRTIQKDCQKLGIDAEVLWDHSGALRRDLNIYFLPRAYQVGSAGTLTWVQRPGEAIDPTGTNE